MHVSKKYNENCNRSGKTKHTFYHENIAELNKLTDKIFDLQVQVMTSLMHFGRKEGDDVPCHVSKLIIHIRDYSTALFTRAVAFCSNTVSCSYFICANLHSFEFKIVSD